MSQTIQNSVASKGWSVPIRIPKCALRVIRSVISACLLAVSLPQVAFAAGPDPIVMRMAHYQPEQRVLMRAIKWWGKELEKRTDGRVKVEHFFAGQLAKAKDILALVSAGGIDLGTPALTYHVSEFPLMQLVIDYPWKSLDELMWVAPRLVDQTEALKAEWKRNNVVPLSYGGLPPYGVVTTRKVEKLADLEGCKIRVWGKTVPKRVSKLDMVPVTMPSSETYEAMAKGTAECSLSPTDQHKSLGLYEVAKFHVTGDFIPALYAAQPIMNAQKFAQLDPEIREVIMDLQSDHIKKVEELIAETDQRDREFLKEQGVNFVPLSTEENERIRQDALSIWEASAAELQSQDAVEEIKQAIERLRAEYDAR